MNVFLEPARLSETKEVFLSTGDMVSYYPVTMEDFIGFEGASPIVRMAGVLSRTTQINQEDVEIDYFLSLHPRVWSEIVEHADLP